MDPFNDEDSDNDRRGARRGLGDIPPLPQPSPVAYSPVRQSYHFGMYIYLLGKHSFGNTGCTNKKK